MIYMSVLFARESRQGFFIMNKTSFFCVTIEKKLSFNL